MKVLGVIAEYDPFHNGHAAHLSAARALVRPDAVCVALSPCFRQRGALSLLSPSDRAACALAAGADAVVALPVLWTVRDAEHYALGAVSLLVSLGATHLSFGAETPDLDLLRKTADLLEDPPASLTRSLRARLGEGAGYPAALSAAAGEVLPGAGTLLSSPNNTLAVCYLRAIRRLNAVLEPVPVFRPALPSASGIASALSRGDYVSAFSAVPAFSARLLRSRFLSASVPDPTVYETLLLGALRALSPERFRALPGVAEGLGNALESACRKASSLPEMMDMLVSRRYPAARIRRLCVHALLGVTGEELNALPLPSSALLLALRKNTALTARWKDSSFRVAASAAEWMASASEADRTSWRIWAQCAHLPPTLPYTDRLVTEP